MNLILGDCIEVMKTLEANSVDTIITDPPYGLEFMGKEWDAFTNNEAFQEWTRQWASEALRVAKPGAVMLCFGGTRTFHRIACGIEDAGWEIRDTMMWIYGSGFPKSYNISKGIDKKFGAEREVVGKGTSGKTAIWNEAGSMGEFDLTKSATDAAQLWDGWGTALKPAFEPIIVAMKPKDGTFVENALKWGVAGLNIDGGRVPTEDSVTINTWDNGARPFGDGAGNPYSSREESGGRWPANVIHDGSEEVVSGFPDGGASGKASGPALGKMGTQGIYGCANGVEDTPFYGDSGSAARFFYCAKASKKERNQGLEGMEERRRDLSRNAEQPSMNNGEGNPYNRGAKPVTNNHPTVKPLSLMTYLARLTATPTGGLVLDPFMGSGTTGMACKKTGRDFIGIELDPHYFEIAKKRIESVRQVEMI